MTSSNPASAPEVVTLVVSTLLKKGRDMWPPMAGGPDGGRLIDALHISKSREK